LGRKLRQPLGFSLPRRAPSLPAAPARCRVLEGPKERPGPRRSPEKVVCRAGAPGTAMEPRSPGTSGRGAPKPAIPARRLCGHAGS
jgi:hypothetical protein